MSVLKIRVATNGDLPALLVLYQHLNEDDAIPEGDAAEEILEALTQMSGSQLLLGWEENVLVASCTLMILPNLTRGGRPFALIENVVTHADYRRKGYAREILESAIEQARAYGCYKVMLLTSGDANICRFYERVGFKQTKTGFQVRLG